MSKWVANVALVCVKSDVLKLYGASDVNFFSPLCVVVLLLKGAMSIQKCLLDNSSRMIKAMSTAKSNNSETKTVSVNFAVVCLCIDLAVNVICVCIFLGYFV